MLEEKFDYIVIGAESALALELLDGIDRLQATLRCSDGWIREYRQ